MVDYLGTGINLLLVLVTIGTVTFAKRSLAASDSPRIVVKKGNVNYKIDEEYIEVKAEIKNYGEGIATKVFLLLEVSAEIQDYSMKFYYLSKPLVTLESKKEDVVYIKLEKEDIRSMNIYSQVKVKKAYVISQDFFYNLYYSELELNNNHLMQFAKPVKHITKYGFKYGIIKYKLKRAKQQKNTYVDRVQRRIENDEKMVLNIIKK